MSDDFFSLKITNYSIVFGLFGVLLCLSSVYLEGHLQFEGHNLLAHLTRDLGIAFLVGIYLMWTLDRLNSLKMDAEIKAYIKAVGDNFIQAAYGKELPPELFSVVKKSFFDQSFIRKAFYVDVSLHDFNDAYINAAPESVKELLRTFHGQIASNAISKELIVFKMSSRYEVHNVSSIPAKYEVVFEVPQPFGGNYDGLCGITSVLIDGQQKITDAVLFKTENAKDRSLLSFSLWEDIAEGQSIRVALEAYSIRTNDDVEPWQTLIPSNGMNMTATDADGTKDIILTLDAPLLLGGEPLALKDRRTNKATLSITQYLLPYQGISIKWTPSRIVAGLLPTGKPETSVAGTQAIVDRERE
jgi:hypothetical protein